MNYKFIKLDYKLTLQSQRVLLFIFSKIRKIHSLANYSTDFLLDKISILIIKLTNLIIEINKPNFTCLY